MTHRQARGAERRDSLGGRATHVVHQMNGIGKANHHDQRGKYRVDHIELFAHQTQGAHSPKRAEHWRTGHDQNSPKAMEQNPRHDSSQGRTDDDKPPAIAAYGVEDLDANGRYAR